MQKKEERDGVHARARAGDRAEKGGRGDDGVLSRRDLAEEVQTRLHLHNRYIPAAWTGMEVESSVSSVRYIARLVLTRWQSPEISGRNWREREKDEQKERECDMLQGEEKESVRS